MIAVIDYGVGNLFSLRSSLRSLGLEAAVTADPAAIRAADRVILPGVGAFGDAMARLNESGLAPVIRAEAARKPLLGICLGMQLLFDKSCEYGEHAGLGLVPGQVCPLAADLRDPALKVPQIGWNALRILRPDPLFRYLRQGEYVYYVQLLRQALRREHPRGQRLLHPGHRGGAVGPCVGDAVPPRKERGRRAAHLTGVCGVIKVKEYL